MLHISKNCGLKSAEVIERASKFFGDAGLGLEEKERNACCITFEGVGGHVFINLVDEDGQCVVDVETREWEYHVMRFLDGL